MSDPQEQELIESYYDSSEAFILALQYELNKNRGYRKLLVFTFFSSVLMYITTFIVAAAAVWIAIHSDNTALSSRDFLDVNKSALLDRIERNTDDVDHLKQEFNQINNEQAFLDLKFRELDDIRLRLAEAEISVQVVRALLKSYRNNELTVPGVDATPGLKLFQVYDREEVNSPP